MSWLYSQALVEEYSGQNSSDSEPCALLKSNITPQAFLWQDKTMGVYQHSLFGITCVLLTENLGVELLMWFLVASRVKTSHAQIQQELTDLTEKEVDCGKKCSESFAMYDHSSCLWKTAQCSLFGGLSTFSGIWPRWGSMLNGACWERTALQPPTFVSESGLWPTPIKSDYFSFCHSTMKWKEEGKTRPSGASIGTSLKWDRRTIPYLVGGKIHPILHEWLMGWPITWTDLCELETGRFLEWCERHGTSCAKEPPQYTAEQARTSPNSRSTQASKQASAHAANVVRHCRRERNYKSRLLEEI